MFVGLFVCLDWVGFWGFVCLFNSWSIFTHYFSQNQALYSLKMPGHVEKVWKISRETARGQDIPDCDTELCTPSDRHRTLGH